MSGSVTADAVIAMLYPDAAGIPPITVATLVLFVTSMVPDRLKVSRVILYSTLENWKFPVVRNATLTEPAPSAGASSFAAGES
jgi:hypothetical protein